MGLVTSRFNLEGFGSNRQRSQQDETLYSYSLNKNYFSNFFFMGGERFEVNDPDYLFGDNCDLNFLSCNKPYSLPYKKAQQSLLLNLNSKHKAINKVSSRVNRLSSPFNILSGNRSRQVASSRKQQDAQTQTLNSSKGSSSGTEPSQPLVMLINIRKETLRLVRSSTACILDSDQNSLNNSTSTSSFVPQQKQKSIGSAKLTRRRSSLKNLPKKYSPQQQHSSNRPSTVGSRATTATLINSNEVETCLEDGVDGAECRPSNSLKERVFAHEVGSISSSITSKSGGYRSVKDIQISSDEDRNVADDDDDDSEEEFKDALNDTANIYFRDDEDDEDSEKAQQTNKLLSSKLDDRKTKGNRDIKLTNESTDHSSASNSSDNATTNIVTECRFEGDRNGAEYSTPNSEAKSPPNVDTLSISSKPKHELNLQSPAASSSAQSAESDGSPIKASSRVYNIEFNFDTEVDCSIRIFYFCTREITSNGVAYKPQHATYKSKVYYYKKGMDQKFGQPEHTFQPYLFDEDLLIYKPLDLNGNYNSGAVFPIVIHCVALEGPMPRQSHSLVATVEKSQLDESYSIKPLKQLIFADGVQYILQDIYGIEHRQLSARPTKGKLRSPRIPSLTQVDGSMNSISSNADLSRSVRSNLNFCETSSMASLDLSLDNNSINRGSLISNAPHKSLASENTFECVICMSEERDTMLLPCRHLCLCSSCAQSLRYQANSCPICRCPFKAALNLRSMQRNTTAVGSSSGASTTKQAQAGASSKTLTTKQANAIASADLIMGSSGCALKKSSDDQVDAADGSTKTPSQTRAASSTDLDQRAINRQRKDTIVSDRRGSVTTSVTTPLLSTTSSTPQESGIGVSGGGRTDNRIKMQASVKEPSSLSTGEAMVPHGSASDGGNGLEMRPLNAQWK